MRASILITDDDRGFRETLQGVFEPEGFETLLAANGPQALDILRARDVHLLLLDMHMPRMTGLETLRLAKQLKRRLPCILLSAQPDERLVEQALRADAFSFLTKPVSRQTLTSTVRTALAKTYGWPGEAAEDATDWRLPGPDRLTGRLDPDRFSDHHFPGPGDR